MARKRCLTISFKNTSKDLKLYDLVNNMEDRSNEIKRALYSFYFGNESKDSKKKYNEPVQEEEFEDGPDVMDF